MGHLPDTRVFIKSILDIIPKPIALSVHAPLYSNFNRLFKLPLQVEKRWDILLACQKKMGHLSGTRVSTISTHNYSENMYALIDNLHSALRCHAKNKLII